MDENANDFNLTGEAARARNRELSNFTELESAEVAEFYAAIDRGNLTHKISPERPYVYTTMEIYDQKNGIRGAGGLGILAADTRRIAEELEIPFVVLTPFYREETRQKMRNSREDVLENSREIPGNDSPEDSPQNFSDDQSGSAKIPREFTLYDEIIAKDPADFGYEYLGETKIHFANSPDASLEIHQKICGSTRFLTISEKNFGALYVGEAGEDHRLYQMVSLGFGGYAALKLAKLKPAVMQLNETAATFAAVARLDELCANGMDIYEAIVYVRKHTLYTNHTLVQAAEPNFSFAQFEKFVFPNIASPALRHFISGLFREGYLRLNDLTIELAEAKNCVSKLHARTINVRDLSGERVEFRAITNGIDLPTWVDPEILQFYRENEIVDKFFMPGDRFREKLEELLVVRNLDNSRKVFAKNLKSDPSAGLGMTGVSPGGEGKFAKEVERLDDLAKNVARLRGRKRGARGKLNEVLKAYENQYGGSSRIPDEALVFSFKRRFVEYKRPWLPFENIAELKDILTKYNVHYVMAGAMMGNVNPGDKTYDHLQEMLREIANDEVLRERVHYIVDYDENLAQAISAATDVSINVPEVGWEACGTSFMKDIANLSILISTNDGGVADVEPPEILLVHGETEAREIASLYERMREAAEIWRDDERWAREIARELSAYLTIISGTRMMRDYLQFLFKDAK